MVRVECSLADCNIFAFRAGDVGADGVSLQEVSIREGFTTTWCKAAMAGGLGAVQGMVGVFVNFKVFLI